ncbi:hypothetical protein L3Y34_013894 [Caenorhabditis briggsae]|uniref:ELM2 domain-containing protein n=1 Tax=Caenorhabditis briggsae TaxID=6238 RepID=A0AAE8ZV21_CAEBR|nr:hypothetical protein L3Y34_013894 [Caenorhabditis briggsae]
MSDPQTSNSILERGPDGQDLSALCQDTGSDADLEISRGHHQAHHQSNIRKRSQVGASTPDFPAPKRADLHCYDSIDEDCATSGAPSPCSSLHGSTNNDMAVTRSTSPRLNAPRTRRSMRHAATFNWIPEQEPFTEQRTSGIIGLARKPFSFKKGNLVRLEDEAWRKLWEQEHSISDKEHEWRKQVKEEAEKNGKYVNARINVGPNFQARFNEDPPHTFGEDYLEDLTRAEVIFNPHDREEAWNKVCPKIRQLNKDEYYDWSRNIYWRAIYRQFEGRITFEAALEHLQQCGFDFRIALDTIDQKLHNVPQETRLIPAGRVKTIAALMVKPEVTRRAVQASAMRNWHLPEIQMFWEQFIRFYSRQATFGVGCNCNDPVYMDVAFEPRVGCLVCTRHRRLHADPSKKCLICLTYEKIFEHEKKSNSLHRFSSSSISRCSISSLVQLRLSLASFSVHLFKKSFSASEKMTFLAGLSYRTFKANRRYFVDFRCFSTFNCQ